MNKTEQLIRKVSRSREDVFVRMARRDSDVLWQRASLERVRKAVVISAASRSGSSLLYAICKKLPFFYAPAGESVPFLKLNGFAGDSFLSDEVPPGAWGIKARLQSVSRDLMSDFSVVATAPDVLRDATARERFFDDVALRFWMQWPGSGLTWGVIRKSAQEALEAIGKSAPVFEKTAFALELIRLLRRSDPALNPYYYDIPSAVVREKFPLLRVPLGPPNAHVAIEEPPFILWEPVHKPRVEDLSNKYLLLKSSADCYRMDFLERLLPHAEIKVIYLSRNPAASINGLYDGWRHRGFFSHNLKPFLREALDISGYSGLGPWGRHWWKYDLPPGWQEYARRPLEAVCAFQWVSANRAIQEYLRKKRRGALRVKYEDVVGSVRSRAGVLSSIADFVGAKEESAVLGGPDRLPVVQATALPRPGRWKKRRGMLLPLLERPDVAQVASGLGYDKKRTGTWL